LAEKSYEGGIWLKTSEYRYKGGWGLKLLKKLSYAFPKKAK